MHREVANKGTFFAVRHIFDGVNDAASGYWILLFITEHFVEAVWINLLSTQRS